MYAKYLRDRVNSGPESNVVALRLFFIKNREFNVVENIQFRYRLINPNTVKYTYRYLF